MSDRIPLDNLTSDQLDALYARIATLEHVAAGNKRHVQLIVPDLEKAEAAIERVTDALSAIESRSLVDMMSTTPSDIIRAVRAALDEPQQPTTLPWSAKPMPGWEADRA